ncbi:MAG: DNA internalization-related competence protein ComEC/Rec2 [Syntrophaceae bacterium]|nr:DNA internalization-related competence protein ComEC/Rec2 [Syntrophaceae bacterium]
MSKPLRLPLIPIFVAYALGLYVGHFDISLSAQKYFILLIVFFALWALLAGMKKMASASWVTLALFFFFGIFFIHSYLHPKRTMSHISRFIGVDRLSLEGTIDRPFRRTPGGTQLLIRSEKVILSNRHIPVEGNLLLICKDETGSFRVGDRLRVLCRLYRPRGFQNPGGFSYERHLAFERVHTLGFLSGEKSWVRIGEGLKNPFILRIEHWRDRIRTFFEREAGFPSSSIFKALVLGEQGDIPDDVKEHFVATGIAHLLAISGDHLGIVALLSFSLLIWVLKRSEFLLLSLSVKKLAAALTIPCILLYTFIAGGGISVLRATIMVITFFLSILFDRQRHLLHTLTLAAFLILLFSPPSLFDVSFQLSFLAVLSILYLVPRLLRFLGEEGIPFPQKTSRRRTILKYVGLSLLTTAVAILGTAPFVSLHFNRISPIGFLTNLFFIPWVGFIVVPISLTAALLSFFFYPLAALLTHLNDLITSMLLRTVASFASLPFASFFVPTPTPFEILLFYLLLFSVVHLRKRAVRYLFVAGCLVFLLDIAFWNVKGLFQKNLSITFIDVGHGDSILLQFPGGKRMLVDGGGLHQDRFDIGKNVIAPLLWNKKIRRIDFLVLTHPDPDHLKGLNFIASHFSIGQFWESGLRVDSEYYRQLEETLSRRRVQRFFMDEDSPPQMMNGVRISFLNPSRTNRSYEGYPDSSLLNNHSLVMMTQFKNIRILLTGDIEKEAEDRMLRKGHALSADVLKIPHHGSPSSSSLDFLRRVKPTHAVLSVAGHPIGRLPHPEVLKRYEELGTKIYRTDQHGAITIMTDGEKIEIKTFVRGQS